MIYILVGNDTKKKSVYIKTLAKAREVLALDGANISKDLLLSYASSVSLFGESQIIILDNIITKGELILSNEDLGIMQNSPTIFVYIEDKLLVANEKKYKKYADIERFEEKTQGKKPAFNTFVIADAFGRHDKVGAWINYREAIDSGILPEPISGILFWKIKTMMLAKPTPLLKKQSGELVSLYHRAHRGECDFVIGLEQFILSSLSK